MQEIGMEIVSWLKEGVKRAGARGAVFGLSGGIDSAVVAALCKIAFEDDALGIIMPCYSEPGDEADARRIASSLDLRFKLVNLDGAFDELIGASEETDNKMAKANIKPRLRMTTLYYHAAINNYLVVGSENKSELFIGYFTKHGDNGVDLMPIGGLLKTQVRLLARHLNILEDIIEKVPSAGLWAGQTDEAEMGFSYDDLDSYILNGTIPEIEAGEKIKRLNKNSGHKRSLPPIFNNEDTEITS